MLMMGRPYIPYVSKCNSAARLTSPLRRAFYFSRSSISSPAVTAAAVPISTTTSPSRNSSPGSSLMRELRYLDKLIDELARGKKMEKILRG